MSRNTKSVCGQGGKGLSFIPKTHLYRLLESIKWTALPFQVKNTFIAQKRTGFSRISHLRMFHNPKSKKVWPGALSSLHGFH